MEKGVSAGVAVCITTRQHNQSPHHVLARRKAVQAFTEVEFTLKAPLTMTVGTHFFVTLTITTRGCKLGDNALSCFTTGHVRRQGRVGLGIFIARACDPIKIVQSCFQRSRGTIPPCANRKLRRNAREIITVKQASLISHEKS